MQTPIGRVLVAGQDHAVELIGFPAGKDAVVPAPDWIADDRIFALATKELTDYFSGDLRKFTFAIRPDGTAFQMAVWAGLARIPYGGTTTYGELAKAIGRPAAVRAVGAANGANQLPIVLPCHRVIGADGSLTGFGGGLDAKQALLKLEGAWPIPAAQPDLFQGC